MGKATIYTHDSSDCSSASLHRCSLLSFTEVYDEKASVTHSSCSTEYHSLEDAALWSTDHALTSCITLKATHRMNYAADDEAHCLPYLSQLHQTYHSH